MCFESVVDFNNELMNDAFISFLFFNDNQDNSRLKPSSHLEVMNCCVQWFVL